MGSDGALWFTNSGNNSIGRITTGGVVTNYTDPGILIPEPITAGPDGALWFANTAGTCDRPDHHHRESHHLHRLEHLRTTGYYGRTGRRAVVH